MPGPLVIPLAGWIADAVAAAVARAAASAPPARYWAALPLCRAIRRGRMAKPNPLPLRCQEPGSRVRSARQIWG